MQNVIVTIHIVLELRGSREESMASGCLESSLRQGSTETHWLYGNSPR